MIVIIMIIMVIMIMIIYKRTHTSHLRPSELIYVMFFDEPMNISKCLKCDFRYS